MANYGVVEVTEPVEVEIIADRLVFTFISGTRRDTYSVSLHKAASCCHVTQRLLEQAREGSRVLPFNKRK